MFDAWFAKSMKKFDEAGKQAVWTSQQVTQTVYQTPSTPSAQHLQTVAQSVAQSSEAHQHGTQIKKLPALPEGYLSLFTHPTLHKSKHSLPCIHTPKRPWGGVQTHGKACPATTPGTGTYFLRGRRHNTFYGNLTIRSTNAPEILGMGFVKLCPKYSPNQI